MLYAQSSSYTVKVERDLEPINPRKDDDHSGEMVCLHKRYNLGDKHDFESLGDFLRDLITQNSTNSQREKIVQAIKADEFNDIRLLYDRRKKKWSRFALLLQYFPTPFFRLFC